MFAKPQKVSGSTLLRNKDVKKLRKDLCAKFPQSCTEEQLQSVFAAKENLKKLGFQAPSRTNVFVAEDSKEPLVVDVSGKGDFFFTVYALWKCADLLPKLVVHAPVSQFVLRGADVMLPGVVFTSMEEVMSLRKGELRAVVARGNPAPMAVGEMLVDAAEIERSGKKGKAMRIVHYFGDELWKMGPQTIPNHGFEAGLVRALDGKDSDAEDEAATDQVAVDVSAVTLEDKPAADDENDKDGEPATITPAEMDELYVQTLLQVLKSPSLKDNQLPMLASTFHASLFLPARPAGVTLNIKQSSFKKTSVFLKQMQARGLISVTEKDGVQTIINISKRHPDVIAHQRHQTEAEAQEQQAQDALKDQPASLAAVRAGTYPPEIEEALGLSPALRNLIAAEDDNVAEFAAARDKTHKYWAPVEIRDLIVKYIEVKELTDQKDKKFVRLNGPLTDAMYNRKPPAGGYPERVSRPELYNQLMNRCTKYHRVKLYPGHEPRFAGGDIRKIEISAEKSKKFANSTVTTVAFYQQFGIDGATFAKEAQKKWGCSATVQPSDDKTKVEEIKIQGQMVQEVLDFLASKYKIATAKYCTTSFGKNIKQKKK
ncbi:TPA: hypothetical protein N0F65_005263 [Lagenidium giganteum]|uniref:SUI1 domain-containing protein n=1 Tax=Lagenidium giganteum TaxID=4803 RepID=A0AAV2YUX1_9STRA|nr:TPA: hypothetical protein N0F65_005263 [Lagenidium giganteum]